jgi:hypothetical protein
VTGNKKAASPDQLKGSVKEAIGKLTGDVHVEAEGRREKDDPRNAGGTESDSPVPEGRTTKTAKGPDRTR